MFGGTILGVTSESVVVGLNRGRLGVSLSRAGSDRRQGRIDGPTCLGMPARFSEKIAFKFAGSIH